MRHYIKMEVWNNMIKYYRSDSKECYHEELEELKEVNMMTMAS